jgi:hypothetical protein
MPRADNFIPFTLETNTTLCAHNPLGAKGCGEAGTIGAPPAIMNAVLDALAPLGITDLDMPATPERVFRASASKPAITTNSERTCPGIKIRRPICQSNGWASHTADHRRTSSSLLPDIVLGRDRPSVSPFKLQARSASRLSGRFFV